MKKKVKITFTIDAHYPDVEETKQLSQDFDKWLKDWALDEDRAPLPLLFKRVRNKPGVECMPCGRVTVKIERDKEVIMHEGYDEWGNT